MILFGKIGIHAALRANAPANREDVPARGSLSPTGGRKDARRRDGDKPAAASDLRFLSVREKGPGKHVHVFFKLVNDQNVLERDENAATCFQNRKLCFQNILAPGESNLERGENATRCFQNKKPCFQNILVPGWIILVRDQNKHVHVFRLHFAGKK
ncbi:MAG: hypothetical protein LBP98_02145 [Tannerella sp.]|jgi:hypothetical protein|nr:hypothetical protein [Tannerella sp.]